MPAQQPSLAVLLTLAPPTGHANGALGPPPRAVCSTAADRPMAMPAPRLTVLVLRTILGWAGGLGCLGVRTSEACTCAKGTSSCASCA